MTPPELHSRALVMAVASPDNILAFAVKTALNFRSNEWCRQIDRVFYLDARHWLRPLRCQNQADHNARKNCVQSYHEIVTDESGMGSNRPTVVICKPRVVK